MSKETTKFEVVGKILPKLTDKMETAGYSDLDIMAIQAVIVYEGISDDSRQLLIEKADLEKAIDSLDGKPVRILFDGENPTGHGYNQDTQTFSPLVANIGFIHWAWGKTNEEENNRYEAVCDMVIWQKYYPEISNRLRQLHQSGELKFSFEMERDFEMTPEGYKKLFNIHFTGVAIVKNPAFEQTRSLLVAELINEGGRKNVDELLKLLGTLKETIGTEIAEQFKTNLGILNEKITTLQAEKEVSLNTITDMKSEIAEKDGVIKTIEAERDEFKGTVEIAEKSKLGAERTEKLKKYGEVKQTETELAEMTKDEFVAVLEDVVCNFKPEIASGVGVKYEKVGGAVADRKKSLLGLIEGLGK